MKFNCHGYVTNWTAHTLLQNSISFLPYAITFQVWRPRSNERSYSLVGSNELRFAGTALRNGSTSIPGKSSVKYFSFNRRVEREERIHFVPGDVVGWFMSTSHHGELAPPLSVLYVRATELDGLGESAVTLYALDAEQESCTVCDIEKVGEGGEIVPAVILLMAPVVGEHVQDCRKTSMQTTGRGLMRFWRHCPCSCILSSKINAGPAHCCHGHFFSMPWNSEF